MFQTRKSVLRSVGNYPGSSLFQKLVNKTIIDIEAPTAQDTEIIPEEGKAEIVEPKDLKPEIELYQYIKEAWKVLEPGTRYKDNWHVGAISEALEAVSRNEILKLIINIAPRCMKSIITSICWPTWEWTWKPQTRWLVLTYELPLASILAIKSRRLIESTWYQEAWGHVCHLTSDQNAKLLYENNKRGTRISTYLGGGLAGKDADRILIDDPHSLKDDQAAINKTIEDYDVDVPSRIADPATTPIVVIGQRHKSKDLTQHLLDKKAEKWETIIIPTEYDGRSRITVPSTRFPDPRTAKGELLWPSRFDAKFLDGLRLNENHFAGQQQQNPMPEGGGLFKESDVRYIDAADLPRNLFKHRHWDTASTEKKDNNDPDFTAGVLLAIDEQNNLYVIDVVAVQQTPGQASQTMKLTAQRDGIGVTVTNEEEKGSAGKWTGVLLQQFVMQDFNMKSQPLWGDKVTRATPLVWFWEHHKFFVVRAAWNKPYVDEFCDFPNGKHKDRVDATSGAFFELSRIVRMTPPGEVDSEQRQEQAFEWN